jgi:hypothetical protein
MQADGIALTPVSELDEAFGHWFAGFFAGEGFVSIPQTGKSYGCCAGIQLRADDVLALGEIQKWSGIGRIKHNQPPRGSAHPLTSWIVHNKPGVIRLARILDRFPVRAKKSQDIVIWREAVGLWTTKNWNAGTSPGECADWSEMAALRDRLRGGREYREVAWPSQLSETQATPSCGSSQQLEMISLGTRVTS